MDQYAVSDVWSSFNLSAKVFFTRSPNFFSDRLFSFWQQIISTHPGLYLQSYCHFGSCRSYSGSLSSWWGNFQVILLSKFFFLLKLLLMTGSTFLFLQMSPLILLLLLYGKHAKPFWEEKLYLSLNFRGKGLLRGNRLYLGLWLSFNPERQFCPAQICLMKFLQQKLNSIACNEWCNWSSSQILLYLSWMWGQTR